ncbi:class I SAM-dependent methyltransferase [Nocardioides speluncae]|uniref:class I SAM-dependent methyltransferase n=1 Tax=Nocardioides speluncae TaxID=2670337 RepID=UPI000D68D801|nr:class I SAM-dependent methyltransferase [Nocardioides speluncae]
MPSPTTFEEAFAHADAIPGWLTRDQAAELFRLAAAVPPGGTIVEIGTHLGRSAVVLGLAARPGVKVVAVDPFLPDWRYGRADSQALLRENLAKAGVAGRVEVHAVTSEAARATWSGPVNLVYVDGGHSYWACRDDLGWASWVPADGHVLVHDAFSSLGVTTALLRHVLPSSALRYAGRTGSLATLVVGRPAFRDRARFIGQLPWWLRNLVVKVLLRLRLRPLAAVLGHRGQADPY